jgi:hypothetical protein
MGPGSAAHHAVENGALRSIRGTSLILRLIQQRALLDQREPASRNRATLNVDPAQNAMKIGQLPIAFGLDHNLSVI